MNPTLAKILSRFDGDEEAAFKYCLDMAAEYPHLWDEYVRYAEALESMV